MDVSWFKHPTPVGFLTDLSKSIHLEQLFFVGGFICGIFI